MRDLCSTSVSLWRDSREVRTRMASMPSRTQTATTWSRASAWPKSDTCCFGGAEWSGVERSGECLIVVNRELAPGDGTNSIVCFIFASPSPSRSFNVHHFEGRKVKSRPRRGVAGESNYPELPGAPLCSQSAATFCPRDAAAVTFNCSAHTKSAASAASFQFPPECNLSLKCYHP